MNQFLAAPGIGREVPSQHQGGLSGYRSVKTGQVKLPFRDVGMDELSCPSSAGLELKSVWMSELVFVTSLRVYGKYWDQSPLIRAGPSPCHLPLEILSQICSSWEVQWSWKGDGDFEQGRTWLVTSHWPHSPSWVWDLGHIPMQAAVSRMPFPTVCLSPGPTLLLGNTFSGFLFVLTLGSADKVLQRFLPSLKWVWLRKYKSYNEYVLLEILKKPMSPS